MSKHEAFKCLDIEGVLLTGQHRKVAGGILGYFPIRCTTHPDLSTLPDGDPYIVIASRPVENISLLLYKLESTGLWAAPEFI